LLALLGEERFTELVRAYVEAFASRSYTLNRLGDRLPGFLASWGPRRGRALRADLARLELAMMEVFDEVETPPLVAEALARVAPGTRFGPYELGSLLGAGGMGEVYRAVDTRLGREVAVKVLSPRLGDDPDFRARFEREARVVSSLSHPNICALYDVGRQDG